MVLKWLVSLVTNDQSAQHSTSRALVNIAVIPKEIFLELTNIRLGLSLLQAQLIGFVGFECLLTFSLVRFIIAEAGRFNQIAALPTLATFVEAFDTVLGTVTIEHIFSRVGLFPRKVPSNSNSTEVDLHLLEEERVCV